MPQLQRSVRSMEACRQRTWRRPDRSCYQKCRLTIYYLSGQCYGYRLYENGEETDSCWGFLGHLGDVLEEIAEEALPESHRDMVGGMREVSDTKVIYKEYEDFAEEMEAMAR